MPGEARVAAAQKGRSVIAKAPEGGFVMRRKAPVARDP